MKVFNFSKILILSIIIISTIFPLVSINAEDVNRPLCGQCLSENLIPIKWDKEKNLILYKCMDCQFEFELSY